MHVVVTPLESLMCPVNISVFGVKNIESTQ